MATMQRATWWRRLMRGTAGCLLGGAMMVPLGPTTTGQAVNQINSNSMRSSMPPVTAPPATRDTMIWVPPRVVNVPGQGTVMVPGHWERVLPGGEIHVPPLVVQPAPPGVPFTVPAGIRPPVDERFNSP